MATQSGGGGGGVGGCDRRDVHEVVEDDFRAWRRRTCSRRTSKRWRGIFLDFVNLITTMPSRHSGDQVHKVDFFPIGQKGAERQTARTAAAHDVLGLVDPVQRRGPRAVDRVAPRQGSKRGPPVRDVDDAMHLRAPLGRREEATANEARDAVATLPQAALAPAERVVRTRRVDGRALKGTKKTRWSDAHVYCGRGQDHFHLQQPVPGCRSGALKHVEMNLRIRHIFGNAEMRGRGCDRRDDDDTDRCRSSTRTACCPRGLWHAAPRSCWRQSSQRRTPARSNRSVLPACSCSVLRTRVGPRSGRACCAGQLKVKLKNGGAAVFLTL